MADEKIIKGTELSSDPKDARDPRPRSLAVNQITVTDNQGRQFDVETDQKTWNALTPLEKSQMVNANGRPVGTVTKEMGLPPSYRLKSSRKVAESGLKRFLPDALATISAGAAGPAGRGVQKLGSQLLGKLLSGIGGRLVGSELGYDVGQITTGQHPSFGYGAAIQGLGEIPGRVLTSTLAQRAGRLRDEAVIKQWARHIEETVPSKIVTQAKVGVKAFAPLAESPRGAYDLASDKGQRLLGDEFEKAIQPIIDSVKGVPIELPLRDAKKLGIPHGVPTGAEPGLIGKTRTSLQGVEYVVVDAGTAMKTAQGQSGGKTAGAYDRIMDEVHTLIDPKSPGATSWNAARQQYKTGQAWRGFLRESKVLKIDEKTGEVKFDWDAYVKSLTPGAAPRKEFERRGVPVEPLRQAGFEGAPPSQSGVERSSPGMIRSLGSLFGLGGGTAVGHPFLGAHAGRETAGAIFPRGLVTKTPLSPTQQAITDLSPALAAEGIRLTPDVISWLMAE